MRDLGGKCESVDPFFMIFVAFFRRSIIVKERADRGDKMETIELREFPCEAFRAILNIEPRQRQLIRRYLECSDSVQSVVRSMFAVLEHPLTTNEDRQRAITTMADALFLNPPEGHDNHGIDLSAVERDAAKKREQEERRPVVTSRLDQLDLPDATFAQRLRRILEEKNVTQEELAERIECTQSAISKMLSRNARPQRKTIFKIRSGCMATRRKTTRLSGSVHSQPPVGRSGRHLMENVLDFSIPLTSESTNGFVDIRPIRNGVTPIRSWST